MAMLESEGAPAASGATLARHTAVLPAENVTGYRAFQAGSFEFHRDEYFARITWPGGSQDRTSVG